MDILEIRLKSEKRMARSWMMTLISAIELDDDDEYLLKTIRGTITSLHDLTVAKASLAASRRIDAGS